MTALGGHGLTGEQPGLLPSADDEPHPNPVIHDDEKIYMHPAAEAAK